MGALFSFCRSLFLPFCHSLFLPFCHFDRSGEIRHAVPTKGGVPMQKRCPRTEAAGVILPVRGVPMQKCCPRTEAAGVILPVRCAPMQKCCPRTEAAGVILPVRCAPMKKCCPRTEAAGVILPVRGALMQRNVAQPPYSIIFSMHFTAARRVSSSMTISSPPLPLRHARTSTSVVARMLLHTRSVESA